ncbi:hypothetical protein ZIOFF_029912 [Zingiber officinale]|uniref:non-specific serine/threonine protein kinase n=1 Tax=Zingiber officinale TaxID=94328 RepID=A0A8J5H295_ZINOF|nr:hypothetical protein ZIOFF_029912 [Zingiber officinale]
MHHAGSLPQVRKAISFLLFPVLSVSFKVGRAGCADVVNRIWGVLGRRGDFRAVREMNYRRSLISSVVKASARAFDFGRTHVVRPKGRHLATVVWLHGLGDNGARKLVIYTICARERHFRAEVGTISRAHHRHLVSLVAYCVSENQRLLVYDYVPNRTLYYHLHGKGRAVMQWTKRVKVAVGTARGIAYLHEDCNFYFLSCSTQLC